MSAVAALLIACAETIGVGAGSDGPGSVASVTVSPDSAALDSIGATTQLSAEARDGDGNVLSDVSFGWSSSNTAVATVDTTGLATAQDTGSALIIATADGVADSASVSVGQETSSGSLRDVVMPDESDFTDHGIILSDGECGDWDWWIVHVSSVAKLDGTYYLYYVAADGSRPDAPCDDSGDHRNRQIGLATSTDGRNFTKAAENPLISHQPSGGTDAGLSGEGGTLVGGAWLDGSTIHGYYGGMEETSNEQVDSDIVHFETTDGTTIENHVDAAQAGDVPGNDELFPGGVVKIDGTWYVFYEAKGDDVVNNTTYMVSGTDPTNLGSAVKVSGFGDGQGIDGNGVIEKSEDRILYGARTDHATGADVEYRSAPKTDPADMTTLEATWSFPDVSRSELFLDREAEEWMLFYVSNPGSQPNEIRLKTAPVQYAQ